MKSALRVFELAAIAAACIITNGLADTQTKSAPAKHAASSAKVAPKVELPVAIKTTFEAAYPNATIKHVSREKEDGENCYEVESMDGTLARDLIYRADGTVVEIEEAVSQADLPQPVQQAISSKYPKGKVLKAEKLTRGQTLLYEIRVKIGPKKHEVTFDPTGAQVTAKKEGQAKAPKKSR